MKIALFIMFAISIYGAYREYVNFRAELPKDLFESDYEPTGWDDMG
jgi:hypothetical protein